MFKIGFSLQAEASAPYSAGADEPCTVPRKSLVQVRFPKQGRSLTYYNDRFDLRVGDFVFVEGSMEGQRGFVQSLSYNFKIRLSDYKRVIGRADDEVHGEFFMLGSHLVSFDPSALPYEKALAWFKGPEGEDGEFVSGWGEESFPLSDLKDMGLSPQAAERGADYYRQDKVVYLALEGSRGRAIVEGSRAYELEFVYEDGGISRLVCDCPCAYPCKHEAAAMLQLRDCLERIEAAYPDRFRQSGSFYAVSKTVFFAMAVNGKERGRIEL